MTIISNGKLILGFDPIYVLLLQWVLRPVPFPIYCALVENNYYKKVFLLYFASQVMGSDLADTCGKAAT